MKDLTTRAIEALVGPLNKQAPAVADSGPDPRDEYTWREIALLLALEEMDDDPAAERSAFNAAAHPRNPKGSAGGGRFRSLVDRVKDAVTEHKKSGGKGSPLAGFNRQQLQRVAKARGIKLQRGESESSISKKILDHLGGDTTHAGHDKVDWGTFDAPAKGKPEWGQFGEPKKDSGKAKPDWAQFGDSKPEAAKPPAKSAAKAGSAPPAATKPGSKGVEWGQFSESPEKQKGKVDWASFGESKDPARPAWAQFDGSEAPAKRKPEWGQFADKKSGRTLADFTSPDAWTPDKEAETEKAVREAIDGTYGGLEVKTDSVVGRDGALFIHGGMFNADGQQVGRFARSLRRDDDGKLVASHDMLMLSPKVQGSGFSREFNGHLIDLYRQSDVDRVETHANIDVGGYTWASAGFDFASDDAAATWLEATRKRIATFKGQEVESAWGGTIPSRRDQLIAAFPNLTPEQADAQLKRIEDLLDDMEKGNPHSAYEISQLGRQPGQGKNDMWIGKFIMAGSTWEGALRL